MEGELINMDTTDDVQVYGTIESNRVLRIDKYPFHTQAKVEYLTVIPGLDLRMPRGIIRDSKKMDFSNNPEIVQEIISEHRIPFALPMVIEEIVNIEQDIRYELQDFPNTQEARRYTNSYYIYETEDGIVCVKSTQTHLWTRKYGTIYDLEPKDTVMNWKDAEKELQMYGIDLDASKADSTHQMDKLLDTRKYRGIRGVLIRLSNYINNSRQGKTDKGVDK